MGQTRSVTAMLQWLGVTAARHGQTKQIWPDLRLLRFSRLCVAV